MVLNCCDCLDFSNVIFDLRDISGCQDCTCNLPQSLPWSVSNGWIFYICMWELAQDTTFLSGKQGKKNNNDATVFFRRETSTGSRCGIRIPGGLKFGVYQHFPESWSHTKFQPNRTSGSGDMADFRRLCNKIPKINHISGTTSPIGLKFCV